MSEEIKEDDSALTLSFDKNGQKEMFVISNKENLRVFYYMLEKHISISNEMIAEKYFKEVDRRKFLNTRAIFMNKLNFLQCLEKINLSDLSNFSKVPIHKDLIHKTSQNNVMITEIKLPLNIKIGLFSGDINHTDEINLDHINKEHTEAIFLTELCRQSCMVCLSNFWVLIRNIILLKNTETLNILFKEIKKYSFILCQSLERLLKEEDFVFLQYIRILSCV